MNFTHNGWTFTFYVDPKLNMGAVEAFNQCGEPWWWAVDGDGNLIGAGDINFKGAKFKSLYLGKDVVLEELYG